MLLHRVLCGEAEESLVTARGGGESEKGQVVTGIAFVAGAEPAEAGQSGDGAFDDPAASPQLIVSEWVELRALCSTILVGGVSGVRVDLVPDDLWERVAPLLPPAPERRHRDPGRLRVPDRVALAGVMYVLRTGVAWA
ncbi:hypothetical protein GCM10010254_75660 [Streptomyces chromofuscus]|nr:hypothetical protein GCM10010254_75660 [Streptomyces chromofuscus]